MNYVDTDDSRSRSQEMFSKDQREIILGFADLMT